MSDKNKRDHLEEYLKQALEGLNETPSEDVWAGIDAQLTAQEGGGSGKGMLIMLRQALPYLVAAGLALLLWWKSEDSKLNLESSIDELSVYLEEQNAENKLLAERIFELEEKLSLERGVQLKSHDQIAAQSQNTILLLEEIKHLKRIQRQERQKSEQLLILINQTGGTNTILEERLAAQNGAMNSYNEQLIALRAELLALQQSEGGLEKEESEIADKDIDEIKEEIASLNSKKAKSEKLFFNGSNELGLAASTAQGVTDLGLGDLNYAGGLRYKRNMNEHLSATVGLSFWTQDYTVKVSEVDYNSLENQRSFSENDILTTPIGRASSISKQSNTIKMPLMLQYNMGNPNKKLNYFVSGGWVPTVYIKEDFQLSYVPTHGQAEQQNAVEDRYVERSFNYSEGSLRAEAGMSLRGKKTNLELRLFNDLGIAAQGADERRISQFGLSANWFFFKF